MVVGTGRIPRHPSPSHRWGLRGMHKHTLAALAVSLLLLGACGDRPSPQHRSCFDAPDSAARTPVEELVLADARRRSASACTGPGQQCRFALSQPLGRAPGVFVEFGSYDFETDECIELVGGHALLLYDAHGKYVETRGGL